MKGCSFKSSKGLSVSRTYAARHSSTLDRTSSALLVRWTDIAPPARVLAWLAPASEEEAATRAREAPAEAEASAASSAAARSALQYMGGAASMFSVAR